MKTIVPTKLHHTAWALIAAILVLPLTSCGKKGESPQGNLSKTASSEIPLEQILQSWQNGDQAGAVERFMAIDWKSSPLFRSGSALSHRESDLPGMSASEQETTVSEANAQLGDLKKLAAVVREKGVAAVGTDPEFARRCFTQLEEFAGALNQPDNMTIVQLVGKAIGKMAAVEAAKMKK